VNNRVFISLVCNFLLGIFFCFPVYSAQTLPAEEYTEKFYSAFEKKDKGNNGNSDEAGENIFAQTTRYGKIEQFGNKSHLQAAYEFVLHRYEISPSSPVYYAVFLFVDLSYLKELRVTKMLC
jgi:hypothetical protein